MMPKFIKHIITENDSKALKQALNTLTGWTEKMASKTERQQVPNFVDLQKQCD